MMDQSSSIPTCEVCFETYDLENRIPKNMPCCGKTFCKKCQEKMKRDQRCIRCPWCKHVHAAEEEFKTNFPLLDVIGENLKWEICDKHGEAMKLFCRQHASKVCAYCQALGANTECKEHEIVPLETLKTEAENSRKKFQKNLEDLENKYPESKKQFAKGRETIADLINKCFENQKKFLQESRIKTLHHFNLSYEKERVKFDENFGEDSSLRADLKSIISNHMNIFKIPDPKEIIDRDYSRLQDRCNYFTGSNSNGLSFEQQLSQFVPNMRKSILEQDSRTKNNWDSFIENVEKKINIEVPEGFNNSTETATCTKKEMLKFNSRLKFIMKKKTLTIAQGNKLTEVQFSLQNLQAINKVVVKFGSFSNIEFDRISQVFGELNTRQSFDFEIKAKEEKKENYSINEISRLFSILCQKPEIINELRLSLNLNDEIVILLNLILPQLSILSSFHIKIQDANISPEPLSVLLKNLRSVAPRLESLGLDFSKTKLSLSLFKEILIKMPVLKSFSLNASQIADFNKDTISPLLDDAKNIMPKLEELILDVSQTKIPASDAAVLKDRFRHIKNVEVKLRDPESEKAQNQASQSQISPPKSKNVIPIDDDDDDTLIFRNTNQPNPLVTRISGNGRNQSPAANRILVNGQNQSSTVNSILGNGPRLFGNSPYSQGYRY